MPITSFDFNSPDGKPPSLYKRTLARMAVEARTRRVHSAAEYRYGLVSRPPSLGAVPKGFTHYDPSNQGIDGVRHGVLTYDHALSDHEVKQFELLPLTGENGGALELPKFPSAVVRKIEPAVQTLLFVAKEYTKPYPEDIQEEVDAADKMLDIFRKYAESKHLDADKALRELNYHGSGRTTAAKESEEEKEVKEPSKDTENVVKEPKSEKPSQPKTTTEIEEPAKPNEPEKPSKPAEPAKPSKPNKPSEPTKVAKG